MADIEIEKRSAPAWPWIVSIAVLALIVISLTVLLLGEEEQAGADPSAGTGAPASAATAALPEERTGAAATGSAADSADAIAAYRAATDNLTPEAVTDPARLESLLDRLAAAVSVLGEAAPERAAALRARADSTRLGDWRLPRQMMLVRNAFDDAAAVIAAAAERGMRGVHATVAREVATAAGHVSAERPLAAQGPEVVAFLQRVTRAFEGMR